MCPRIEFSSDPVAAEAKQVFTMAARRDRDAVEFTNRKNEDLSALTARGKQLSGKTGERRIQVHTQYSARRKQASRDFKVP
jgi:hypothetical protein